MTIGLVIFIYILAMTILLVLSLGQLHLAWIHKHKNKSKAKVPQPSEWPMVTIQLPIYNELYVVERLLDSIALLDYPKEKLQIQILDDSTDETSAVIKRKVEDMQKKQFDVSQIQRPTREGFKAGALQYGLLQCKGEYLAIFDADFIPNSNFLRATIPHILPDNIGMVQTRWGHLNKDYSLLTKLQAFGLDGHFIVEQSGRNEAGCFINFNGTGGVWRKSCIIDAGGWSADTLTEDLDLSYRAQLKGWHFEYLEHEVIPAELPMMMSAVKSQQYRWNKGAAETARKTLWSVLQKPLPIKQKLHAVFHLANNSVFLFIVTASIISVPMLGIKHHHPVLIHYFHMTTIFALGFFAVSFFYWQAAVGIQPKRTFRYWGKYFPLFMSYSMGLSFHNAIAVAQGYLGFKSPFVRTPKFNAIGATLAIKTNKYVPNSFQPLIVIEMILCAYFFFGMIKGISYGDYGLLPFHLMLACGYGIVAFYGIQEYLSNGSPKH